MEEGGWIMNFGRAYHATDGLILAAGPLFLCISCVREERQHPEKYIPMCIKRVRDNQKITVHSNPEKTKAGSRHYIHARDVADALMFLYNYDLSKLPTTYGGAKCQKFNIVGAEEFDNLELAQFIADTQGRPLNYEMVDFHGSRPGHDLRYALDGGLLKG